MSNLDIYSVSHFDEKQLFVHMGELRLTLDPKDFATNGYQVDERQHPRNAPKAFGRKGKGVVPSEDESEEMKSRKRKTLLALGPRRVRALTMPLASVTTTRTPLLMRTNCRSVERN